MNVIILFSRILAEYNFTLFLFRSELPTQHSILYITLGKEDLPNEEGRLTFKFVIPKMLVY